MKKRQHDLRIVVPRFEEEAGFYTTEKHSRIMSRIRSNNTKSEILLRKLLWSLGVRYRINAKSLPGKPDIAIRKFKLAIFIDGDFWHGYDWENRKKKIKTNKAYWLPKIERNMQRDLEVNQKLFAMDWTVIRFWEHQVDKDIQECARAIIQALKRNGWKSESESNWQDSSEEKEQA